MDANKYSLIRKIKKLFALASSTHSFEEAESALLKAKELLITYNLSVLELEQFKTENTSCQEKRMLFPTKIVPKWAALLASHISTYFDCHVYFEKKMTLVQNKKQNKYILDALSLVFIGVPPDPIIAQYVYSFLYAIAVKAPGAPSGKFAKNSWRLGFVRGVANKIDSFTTTLGYKNKNAIDALVPFKKKNIENYLSASNLPSPSTKQKIKLKYDSTSYADGFKVGVNTHLKTPIS